MEKLGQDMDGIRITENGSIDTPVDAGMDIASDAIYELRIAPDKGYGLFATKDIKRGTCIISESPLFVISVEANNEPRDRAWHAVQALEHLTTEQLDIYSSLHAIPVLVDPAQRAAVRTYLRTKQYNGEHLKTRTAELIQMLAIYNANSVVLGPRGSDGSGIFPTYSRCNHSCTPNAENWYNINTAQQTLHAVRDIAAGEEITVTYINDLQIDSTRRARELEEWRFKCSSAACTGPGVMESALRRSEIASLVERLKVGNARTASGGDRLPRSTPQDRAAALSRLRLAEQMVALCEEEGLLVQPLMRGLRYCADNALDAGLLIAATAYTQRQLEVEVACYGEGGMIEDSAQEYLEYYEYLATTDNRRFRTERDRVRKKQMNEQTMAEKAEARERRKAGEEKARRWAEEERAMKAQRAAEEEALRDLQERRDAAARAERKRAREAAKHEFKKAKRAIRAVVKEIKEGMADGFREGKVELVKGIGGGTEALIANMSNDEVLALAEKLRGDDGEMDAMAVLSEVSRSLVEAGRVESEDVKALL